MKKKTVIKAIVVVALAIFLLMYVRNFRENHRITVENEVETSVTVNDIQRISELVTSSFYGETAMRSKKGFMGRKEIVMIGSGTVRAGFDLSSMTEDDFYCDGDTLYLDLPEAKILDVIVNPKDYEIFDCNSKDWSQNEINDIVSQMRKEIEHDAIKYGVFETANTEGVKKMQRLLMDFGFADVRVSVTKSGKDYPKLNDVEK